MKMQAELPAGPNAILRHSASGVVIGEETITHSVLVPWSGALTPWPVQTVGNLTAEHIDAIVAARPEVVIFGTGKQLTFIHPRITQSLMAHRIGFEVMDTPTACRTFNVLLQENRQVLAALMFTAD